MKGGIKMIAKMRKVMYRVETPWDGWTQTCYWTASYKEATSNGNRIIETKLFPVDDLTKEQRETREKYREKVWVKFHNKPRA